MNFNNESEYYAMKYSNNDYEPYNRKITQKPDSKIEFVLWVIFSILKNIIIR